MSNINDFIIENGVLKEYVGDDEAVIIPEGVVQIGKEAFSGREDIVSVTIPDGVTSIGEKAFSSECITICAPKGSYAETYAKENDIPFVAE